jgi:hypothetical protein
MLDFEDTITKGPPGVGLGLLIRQDPSTNKIVVEKVINDNQKIQVGDVIRSIAGADIVHMDFIKVMTWVKSLAVGQVIFCTGVSLLMEYFI